MRIQAKLCLGAAVLLLAFGCSAPKDTASSDSQFSAIYTKSFSVTCVNCHNPSVAASTYTNLDMSTSGSAYTGLMERVVRPAASSTCPNDFRVSPGQTTKSYLLGLLFADHQSTYAGTPGCTAPTSHAAGLSFTADEKSAIVNWIQAGAAR